jgi:hypothetical protein
MSTLVTINPLAVAITTITVAIIPRSIWRPKGVSPVKARLKANHDKGMTDAPVTVVILPHISACPASNLIISDDPLQITIVER